MIREPNAQDVKATIRSSAHDAFHRVHIKSALKFVNVKHHLVGGMWRIIKATSSSCNVRRFSFQEGRTRASANMDIREFPEQRKSGVFTFILSISCFCTPFCCAKRGCSSPNTLCDFLCYYPLIMRLTKHAITYFHVLFFERKTTKN